MSPQLHTMVYGFHQHNFAQTVRFGGFRPTVFMDHGLAVGMWMTVASLAGYWLWRTRILQVLFGRPVSLLLAGVVGTALLCKSLGALVLLAMGVAALEVTRASRSAIPVLALLAAPVVYVGLRATGLWDGSHLVNTARAVTTEERVHSLQFRLDAEDVLADRARERPILGWGGWGRNQPRPLDEYVKPTVTDGLWIITFGTRGWVGLLALLAVMLVPCAVLLRRVSATRWSYPALAAPVALATILMVFMIDCLLNAMPNPLYVLAAGGLSGFVASLPRRRRGAPRSARPAPVSRPGLQVDHDSAVGRTT